MCTKYEKPVVEINNSAAEGVYAASGTSLCGSKYITEYFYGTGTGNTYYDFYGCAGCNNNRNNTSCALFNGEYDSVVAESNGDASKVEGYLNQAPRWEREGHAPDAEVEITYLW